MTRGTLLMTYGWSAAAAMEIKSKKHTDGSRTHRSIFLRRGFQNTEILSANDQSNCYSLRGLSGVTR